MLSFSMKPERFKAFEIARGLAVEPGQVIDLGTFDVTTGKQTVGPKVPADASVTSTVGIGPRSEGGFGLDIELDVSLPGLARADAEALVAKAHQVCPYSNATRGNVDVRLKVV